MGETVVLKYLVCKQPLWLLTELVYKVPGGKMNQCSLRSDLRQSSYALFLYLEGRTLLDENLNPYLKYVTTTPSANLLYIHLRCGGQFIFCSNNNNHIRYLIRINFNQNYNNYINYAIIFFFCLLQNFHMHPKKIITTT